MLPRRIVAKEGLVLVLLLLLLGHDSASVVPELSFVFLGLLGPPIQLCYRIKMVASRIKIVRWGVKLGLEQRFCKQCAQMFIRFIGGGQRGPQSLMPKSQNAHIPTYSYIPYDPSNPKPYAINTTPEP